MESTSKHLWINLIIIIILFSASIARSNDCVYTIYIRTGSIFKGGTDSIINVELYDQFSGSAEIPDLESWGGLMDPGHDYYERGNLDIFSGRGPCLDGPICALKLVSDGTGPHHGWYCNYVEVTSTGPHISCSQKLFTIEQWLARDASPYELTAVRENCPYDDVADRRRTHGMLTPVNSAASSAL